MKKHARHGPHAPSLAQQAVARQADAVRLAAIRAKADADAHEAAALAVERKAADLRHAHAATETRLALLRKEHQEKLAEAERLAREADTQAQAEFDALPWYRKLSGR
jgi:hypothetical protein